MVAPDVSESYSSEFMNFKLFFLCSIPKNKTKILLGKMYMIED